MPSAGDVLAGRYRLVRKLAAGAMGAVFEAEHQTTRRRVAVKLLHPELTADPDLHRRFRREASVLQALDHPAVVQVLDVGSDDAGRAYTVMELLEGETLYDRIRRDPPLTVADLAPIVDGLCSGLTAVHEHGVIHGDLKPANVFLLAADDGGVAVKLVDFGLSKVHGLERLTRTGEIIGTPVYMAPELLTGEGDIDESIDTYALGVLLFEALAGYPPFRERNPGKLLFHIVSGKVEPFEPRTGDVTPGVAQVIVRAMSSSRKARFASAAEMGEAFARQARAAAAG